MCEFLQASLSGWPVMLISLQKILYRSVFPMLREQLINQEMLVLVLPALISLVEHCSDEDYKSLVQPEVKRVLAMSRPVQVSALCMNVLL